MQKHTLAAGTGSRSYSGLTRSRGVPRAREEGRGVSRARCRDPSAVLRLNRKMGYRVATLGVAWTRDFYLCV